MISPSPRPDQGNHGAILMKVKPMVNDHKENAVDGALVVSGIGGALMSHLMDIAQVAQQLTFIFASVMTFAGACLAVLRFYRAWKRGDE